MRSALGLGLLVIGVALACGGDGREPVTAEPVKVFISSFSAHDPSNSITIVAIRFRVTPAPDDQLTLEVLNREIESVLGTLPVDKTLEGDFCSGLSRSQSLEFFSIRGQRAEELQLNPDEHKLRLTIKQDKQEKQFLLDVPSTGCFAIE
ncbi:MAG: hypothetical protein ACE5I2_15385 [Anaerolineae bacterium]